MAQDKFSTLIIAAAVYAKAMDDLDLDALGQVSTEALDHRLSKRQALIHSYRKQPLYIKYKAEKSSEQPNTPVASDHHSKRSWERAMFAWKSAMKTVFWQ